MFGVPEKAHRYDKAASADRTELEGMPKATRRTTRREGSPLFSVIATCRQARYATPAADAYHAHVRQARGMPQNERRHLRYIRGVEEEPRTRIVPAAQRC